MIFGYCRVSTLEQASDDRTSMTAQESVVRLIAMARGSTDPVFFRDPGVSGSIPISDRPAGLQMLSMVQSGDCIVASKMDRMFRSAIDALQTAEEMKKKGVHIILADISHDPVNANGTGQLFFNIMASVAQFERERIADRAQEGRKGKLERGGHIGGEPPYGFKKVGVGREAMLERNELEQDNITRILALYSQLGSYDGVAKQMNALRCYAREGLWVKTQIRRIVLRSLPKSQAANVGQKQLHQH